MRMFLTSVVSVVLLVSFNQAVQAQSAADEAAVRKATQQILAAFNSKDFEAYQALHDEDCLGASGTPCVSGEEFAATAKNAQVKIYEEIGVQFVTPDVAIHRYRSDNTAWLDADGKPRPDSKVLYSTTYVKKDGKWLRAARKSAPIEE